MIRKVTERKRNKENKKIAKAHPIFNKEGVEYKRSAVVRNQLYFKL